MRRPLILAAALLASLGIASAGIVLEPYKDKLFAYPAILSVADDGDYIVVGYDEMRDINGRDEVPERKVQGQYVSLKVRRAQKDLSLSTPAGEIRHFAVGQTQGASVITIYLHGKGGSRKQGVDDFTFGGNFNRIKNLMAANGGLYLSPDFSDFEEQGTREIATLIAHYAAQSPDAGIVVACGSMGGGICWRLAQDKTVAARLSGLVLLGSLWNDGFRGSPAFKAKVPVLLAQGSRDSVFPVEQQEAFYRSVRKAAPGYPIRMVRFETGGHGTPIRMTDWRETLNWMLGRAR
ncbi:MAG: alpha/beta hydrolase family protein [Rhizobiaceae bacterium]